ncbi:MAG: hypothetical protein H0X67_13295 [Acidobacteria bacterium]|nr:hypothetical protein [Acidobacteriota bacterium]
MTDEAEFLIDAFATLTRTIPADENRFGSASLERAGICDGTRGVQWNAWVKWHRGRQMAYAGVNLEGMVYDGWPVARFIDRELEAPRLIDAGHDVKDPASVEVLWYRDAWQVAARLPIVQRRIGGSPRLLHTLTPGDWIAMLTEARECLDASQGHRGRALQHVTTTAGNERVMAVSPHLQIRQAFWPRDPSTADGWRVSLDAAMANLGPLHRAVSAQARLAGPDAR